jgi:hypothetical protein
LQYFVFNNAFLEKTDVDQSKSSAAGSSTTSDGSRREQHQHQRTEKHTKRLKVELRAMRISSRLC